MSAEPTFASVLGAGRTAQARAWSARLAVVVLLVQLAMAAAMVWANQEAERTPGVEVKEAWLQEAGGTPIHVDLPADRCCSRTDLVFTVSLPPDAQTWSDPAILIPSAHDNAVVRIGDVVMGDGRIGAAPTVTSRRPQLVRLPKALLVGQHQVQVIVKRAIGFGHLRPVHFGEYDALRRPFVALRFLRSDLPFANAVIGLFVCAFCLCAAPLFCARRLMHSLSLLGGAWSLQHVGMLLTDAPWGAVANAALYMWAFQATLVAVVWFFIEWTSSLATVPARSGRVARVFVSPWPELWRRRLPAMVAACLALCAVAIVASLQSRVMEALQDIDRVTSLAGSSQSPFASCE